MPVTTWLHWPLAAVVRPRVRAVIAVVSPWMGTALHVVLMPAAALVVFFAARASYRYFESPFLALKSRFSD
jgi:hypothetical protein